MRSPFCYNIGKENRNGGIAYEHTIKIMIPFLMIAGLLTGCGSQVTTGSKAETTQATKQSKHQKLLML